MAEPREAERQDDGGTGGGGGGTEDGGTGNGGGGTGEGGRGTGQVGHNGGAHKADRDGRGDGSRDRPLIEPQSGPGLKPSSRPDPVMVTAVVFALLALIPTTVFRGPNVDLHLGPLQIPVIFAIVAVLFAVLGFLRGHELEDRFIQRVSVAAGAVGLVRLFVYPLLGL